MLFASPFAFVQMEIDHKTLVANVIVIFSLQYLGNMWRCGFRASVSSVEREIKTSFEISQPD